eukprot:TRINITY_DN2091_c0_g1_i1.p1 TRINITY_DN2091_c0_g1~~TRINITY_DN2091_c0_g1_i1.p1  ORF type:complete len:202 (-),score=45.19 TRINITY_DN2091_c0_g1_i1:80-640(-)
MEQVLLLLSSANEKLNQQYQDLQRNYELVKIDNQGLKKDNQGLKKDNQELKKDNEGLKKNIEQIETNFQILVKKNTDLSLEKLELHKTFQEKIKQLSTELEEAKIAVQSFRQQLEKNPENRPSPPVSQSNATSYENHKFLMKVFGELQTEKNNLNSMIESLNKEINKKTKKSRKIRNNNPKLDSIR